MATLTPRRLTMRVFRLLIVLIPIVVVGLIGGFWVRDHLASRVFWQAGLAFALGLEVAYGLIAVLALTLLPTLTVLLVRARRRGQSRPGVARGLLISVSLVFACLLAEAGAAIWLTGLRGRSALPVGGLAGPVQSNRVRTTRLVEPREIILPTVFPEPDQDDTIDLAVVGESSAEGVPYNAWLSIGRLVAWRLEREIPGRRCRLEVVAGSGETLESQHRKLRNLQRRPDVMIIYCGHNEFSSRFPWSRDLDYYEDDRQPGVWDRLVSRVERTSPLCRLIRRAADTCRIAIPPPPGGHRALIDTPAYTEEEHAILLTDFQRRLEAIVAYAEQVGALPILIVPPANESGFEPNRSYLPAQTPRRDREAFARDFEAARQLESSDPETSARQYRALIDRQPGFAEAHFRLARLLERAGDYEGAFRHDRIACDRDGLPMRCLRSFQQAYHEVAARHSCILIDGPSYFHTIGRHGLLDDDLFHDGMHPSLRGQIALAQAVLGVLHARQAFAWPEGTPAPRIDPAEAAAVFGLYKTQWYQLCKWGAMFYDLTAPAHYDPSQRRARLRAFDAAAERLQAGAAPEALGLPNIGIPAPVPPYQELRALNPVDATPRAGNNE